MSVPWVQCVSGRVIGKTENDSLNVASMNILFSKIRSVTKYPFQKAIAVTVEHLCYLTTVAPAHSIHFSSPNQ